MPLAQGLLLGVNGAKAQELGQVDVAQEVQGMGRPLNHHTIPDGDWPRIPISYIPNKSQTYARIQHGSAWLSMAQHGWMIRTPSDITGKLPKKCCRHLAESHILFDTSSQNHVKIMIYILKKKTLFNINLDQFGTCPAFFLKPRWSPFLFTKVHIEMRGFWQLIRQQVRKAQWSLSHFLAASSRASRGTSWKGVKPMFLLWLKQE